MKYLSEKQQKRLTRLKKRMCRMILLFLLIDLALAAVFWNEFRVNTPLAEQQLYTVSGVAEDTHVYRTVRGPDVIYVTVNGREYKLFWRWGREKLETYADYLSAARPRVTVTVLEHQPVNTLIAFRRQIVAISDGQYAFDGSERENSNIVDLRKFFTVSGILLAVLLLPGEVLYFNLSCSSEYRELKKIAKNRAKKEAQQ